MRMPEGYTVQKTLAASPHAEVVLAVRDADQAPVVLKVYSRDVPSGPRARLERELAALEACAGPGVPRAFEVPGDSEPLLGMEYVRGVPLDAWMASGLPDARSLLRVAIQLSEVLVRLHGARRIHRGLAPANVLVDPRTVRAHLVGFSLAQSLGAQSHTLEAGPNSAHLEGALHYISPEQTGRMNRGIDARSDLYSLGATLYLAAAGRPPFSGRDPLALIHAHMARVATPAASLNPELPEPISRIIARLLEKEPGDRYQSAAALRADLGLCEAQLTEQGRIDPSFQLGSAEVPDRPRFASALYGRESEVSLMRERYAEASRGSPQLLMLAGEPGAGKSALVGALRLDLAASNGYLAIGKLDSSRERPHAGWCSALGDLVQQLLVESDARLSTWRTELRAGLGSVARVLVDLVPDLGFVLGETPSVPSVGPRETQARLALAVRRFLAVCATPEHPLVLFLDDLQWSDAASRALLEDLLASQEPCALLLLGAYRANEVHAQHPLAGCLRRIEQHRGPVEVLRLRPLCLEASAAMLAAALERTSEDTRDLAGIIERKTGNAPLFIRQFVDHIHAQGILSFRAGIGWQWDSSAIADAEIPAGAAALLAVRLHRLPTGARSVVELASCVGDDFDVELLIELSGRSHAELAQGLFELADAGLIAPCSNGFRFAHDRVREAARGLLSDEERAALHCGMSRLLLARLSDEERERRVFEIAEHQLKGLGHLEEQERGPALALQLSAGGRALAAGAASTAETYLAAARSLLRPEDWEVDAAQAVDLQLSSAQSAFLRGELETALRHLDALPDPALSHVQRARAEAQRIQILSLCKDPEAVALHTLAVLRRFGASWPLHPSRLRLVLELQALRLELWLRGADRVFRPAKWVDPRRVAVLTIIGQGAVILGRVDDRNPALLACWTTRRNLRSGCISRPAYSLNALAVHGLTCFGNLRAAKRISAIALEHSRRENDPTFGPRAEHEFATLLAPWFMPRRKALAPLEGIANAMRELGDLYFANYCDFQATSACALAGDPVPITKERLREQADRVRRAGHFYLEPELCHQAYALLVEPEPDRISLDERVAEAEVRLATGKGGAERFVRAVWMMVLCVYGRFDLALAQSELIFFQLFRGRTPIHVLDHVFFRGVAAAALASDASRRARRRHRRVLLDSLRRLRRWQRQRGSPDLAHMTLFLEAERQQLAGRVDRARLLYDQAARRAERQTYPHHAALAVERRGLMLLRVDQQGPAAVSLADATRRYREWGCEAKALALERRRGETVNPSVSARSTRA